MASEPSAIEQADIAAAHEAARWRDHPWVKAAKPISKAADQPPMLAFGAGLAVLGIVIGSRRTGVAGLRVLASVALATAIKSAVKKRVKRTRPHVMMRRGYEAEAGGSEDKGEQSFPSGHTAAAVAAARALARALPETAIPAYGFAAAVAALQPAQAKHYVGDVAAGALAGFTAELVVDLLARGLSASAR